MTGNAAKPRKRTREECGRYWLTEPEVDKLMQAAAKLGRHGQRDAAMVLIAYRHGLRVSELVDLTWEDVDLHAKTIYIRRRKNSESGEHTMQRDEVAALRKLGPGSEGHVFTSESGEPMTTSGFFKIVARAGKAAKLGLPIHPHMLRHGCGYYLANLDPPLSELVIQRWMGHRNIQHTLEYTKLSAHRFRMADPWARRKGGAR
jgi:type 1 fimbriae regulatory protein FimB/type 1 fimbriae regulatory protein FimE